MGDVSGSMASLPTVNLGQTVKAISLGEQHTCALLADDSVKCWGYNGNGQLGLNNTTQKGTTAGSIASLTGIHF